MKLVEKSSIRNIEGGQLFDSTFLYKKTALLSSCEEVEIIFMNKLLEKKENASLKKKLAEKPAMYSNVYSPKDELEIFKTLFDNALKTQKKIHIVGVSLRAELDILENYYKKLGFLREDINCFRVDFGVPLVSVSVNIENLIWKGSDYKKMRDKIFFLPPIRESSENKAMFKGINRGVIAGIYCRQFDTIEKEFLTQCITQEKILPLTLGKVLFYNFEDIGFTIEAEEFKLQYGEILL